MNAKNGLDPLYCNSCIVRTKSFVSDLYVQPISADTIFWLVQFQKKNDGDDNEVHASAVIKNESVISKQSGYSLKNHLTHICSQIRR